MKKILITLTMIVSTTAFASLKFFDSSDLQLGNKSEFKCGTGLSCSVVNGQVVANAGASSLTLENAEIINNSTDDTVEVISNDEVTTFKVSGFEAKNSILNLCADQGDDTADCYSFTSTTTNSLLLKNGSTTLLTVDSSGNAVGTGANSISGVLQKQVASTTVAITAAQCGSTFVSNSADIMTLPEASTVLGCRLSFVCGTADDFDVNPADGTDAIGSVASITGTNTTTVLAPSAGDAIRCTDIGSSIVLEAVGADLWVSVGASNGIWTDVN